MQSKKKTVTVGSVELPYNEANNDKENGSIHVPKSMQYIDTKQTLNTMAYAINNKVPLLIIGETGTGKTTAIRHLAHKTNNGFRRLNLNGSTTVDDFVGKTLINESGTYWIDGVLIEAMRKGEWLLLDEINTALPEILFVLHSLLDDDGYVVLVEKDGEVVRPHEDFRIFATCNPTDDYVGTKELNKALLSRFGVVINSIFASPTNELKILKQHIKDVDEEVAKKMISFGNVLRKMLEENELDFVFSTRELVNWYRLYVFDNNVVSSAEYSFIGKCSTIEQNTIRGLLKVEFSAKDQSMKADMLQKGMRVMTLTDVVFDNGQIYLPKHTTVIIESLRERMTEGDAFMMRVEKVGIVNRVLLDKVGNRIVGNGNQYTIEKKHFDKNFILK